jgi:hypothetical protein
MANMQKITAGVAAWQNGGEYHKRGRENPYVYHVRRDCPGGLTTELRHLRAGQGTGRGPCKECARPATT